MRSRAACSSRASPAGGSSAAPWSGSRWTSRRGTSVPDEGWLTGLDADLDAALGALPREQRQALELRVVAELPYAAVARRLGCTPTAARIRVSRGLARLRARLEGSQG